MTIPHQTLTDKNGDRLSITRRSDGLYVTASQDALGGARTAGPFTRAQLDGLLDELAPVPDETVRLGRLVQDVRDGGGHTAQVSGVLIAPCDTYGRTRGQVAQQVRIDTLQRDLEQEHAAFEQTGRDLQTMIGYRDEERARAEKAEQDRDKAQRAAQTLGKVIEDQCRDIAKITGSEDMVAEDGDADWGAIWERGHVMAERLAIAEKERDEARADAESLSRQLHDAQQDADMSRTELEAESRPLRPDAITGEMIDRAQRQAEDFPTTASVSRSALFSILTAALTEPPARPAGAEQLDGHVDASLRGVGLHPLTAEELRTVADNLASEGVRAPEGGAA